jgi:ATP-dependent Clp protease, protease subunit
MSDHYVIFSTGIDGVVANNFTKLLNDLRLKNATRVIIGMNSNGGNVVAGFAMYNMMLAMPYAIETHNTGNIMSIATVLFMGGTKRFANPSSLFMFHGVNFTAAANEIIDEHNAAAKLDTILSDHKRMSVVLGTDTTITPEDAMKMFKEQNTRDAVWAKDKGLVEDVLDFKIPLNATVHPFLA